MESNRVGFCERHMKMLYEGEDRLGLAWMIKTHMEHIIGEIEKRQEAPVKQASFLEKKAEPSELTSYLEFWITHVLCAIRLMRCLSVIL